MRITILASGSAGNAALITHNESSILLDAGLSRKHVLSLLAKHGERPITIQAILLTHCHRDHSIGAEPLSNYLRIPIVGTMGTLNNLPPGGVRGDSFFSMPDYGRFVFSGFHITRVIVPHDAPEPCGFVIEAGGIRLGWFTDLGSIDAGVDRALVGCDAVFLESNHDEDAMRAGPYDPFLKKRVMGPLGHLSNAAVWSWIGERMNTVTRQLILGHLSESANSPELVQAGSRNAAQHAGLNRASNISVVSPGEGISLTV